MKVPSNHTTPVTARKLTAYLLKCGAQLSFGSSHVRVTFPNGEHASLVATQEHVSAVILRGIADKLGISYPDLRKALGHPIQSKGKPRAKPAALPTTKSATKRDVQRAAQAVRSELREIELDALSRDRDPSVYAKAHRSLLTALRTLEGYRSSYAAMRRQAQ